MFLDSLFCVYTTASYSNDTYWKKRCSEWLDDSNIILGCTKATRAATHKTTFCGRPRWCLQCSGKVSGSYLQYSMRYRLFSIYFCHLLASKSTKSSIWRSLYSHLHLLLLVNICWNIPKRLIPLFRQLYDIMFTKLDSFVNLHFAPQKLSILCTV